MASGRETRGDSSGDAIPGAGDLTKRLDRAIESDPELRDRLEGDVTDEEIEEALQFDDESLTPDERARRDAAVREVLRRTQRRGAEMGE